MPSTPRRRGRRRRLGIIRTLERLSDDQPLLCPCGDTIHATCGG
jgi:hypothetical protein